LIFLSGFNLAKYDEWLFTILVSPTLCLDCGEKTGGLTEEIPRQHWIAIKYSTRHRTTSSTKVVRMRNLDLGQTKIKISGIEVSNLCSGAYHCRRVSIPKPWNGHQGTENGHN